MSSEAIRRVWIQIRTQPFSRLGILLALITVLLAGLAAGRLYNGTQGAFLEDGAWDFYYYWSNGYFVRPGSEWAYPLTINLAELPYSRPVQVPVSLTPTLILILSWFSYIPWDLARFFWTAISVFLVLLTPWLVLRLTPLQISFQYQILVVLIFYAMTGTSIAIRAGQPTILILFFILLMLVFLHQKKKLLPGILFGLALSKVAVAPPLLLYLLYKRCWSVIIIGLSVQIIGLLSLAQMVQVSPLTMIQNYSDVISQSSGASYTNLIHIAGHLPYGQKGFIGVGIVISVLLLCAVWLGVFQHKVKLPTVELWDFTMLAVLNVWGLLVVFHHQYDSGFSIFAITLLIGAVNRRGIWGLNSLQTRFLATVTVVGLIAIITVIPGLSFMPEISAIWAPVRWRMMTIGLVILMLASVWLWQQGNLKPTGNP